MTFAPAVRERVLTLAFMLATTVLVVSAVSGAYLLTEDRIRVNASLYLKRAVLDAAGLVPPPDGAAVERLFAERVQAPAADGAPYLIRAADGTTAGYVLPGAGAGLWGTIRAVVGYDARGERLTGIEFIEQNETPGLGARIAEAWFKLQFKGRRGPFSRVAEGAPAGETEFNAITGATITSAAVESIVNRGAADLKARLTEATR